MSTMSVCEEVEKRKVENAAAIKKRSKSTTAQLNYLAEHMKNHPWMASGVSQTLQGRAKLESAWEDLAEKLNSLGGPIKTVPKWKQAWRDCKNNIKKKVSHNVREHRGYGGTGNGPSSLKELSDAEEQVLAVMGPVAVYGIEDISCTEEPSPGPSQDPPTAPTAAVITPPDLEPLSEAKPQATRKRKRSATKHDNFENRLLHIEEEKLKIKKEKNTILARMADSLADISNKLSK